MPAGLTSLFPLLWIAATASPSVAAQPGEATTPSEADTKSPGLALGLSLALPAAGFGMIGLAALPSGSIQSWQQVSVFLGVGLVLAGPSGGQFYTRHYGRAAAFSSARLLLAALAAAAIADGIDHSDQSEADYRRGAARTSMIEAGLCGAGIVALSIWDIIDSYLSARDDSRRSRPGLTLSPLLVPHAAGSSVAGFAVAGTY